MKMTAVDRTVSCLNAGCVKNLRQYDRIRRQRREWIDMGAESSAVRMQVRK